jgi:hypothetical protein
MSKMSPGTKPASAVNKREFAEVLVPADIFCLRDPPQQGGRQRRKDEY